MPKEDDDNFFHLMILDTLVLVFESKIITHLKYPDVLTPRWCKNIPTILIFKSIKRFYGVHQNLQRDSPCAMKFTCSLLSETFKLIDESHLKPVLNCGNSQSLRMKNLRRFFSLK